MTRQAFIEKHRSLLWYIPPEKKAGISDRALVEAILCNGTLEDVRELVSTLGLQATASAFFSTTGRQRGNYPPELYHFFTLVFHRYASSGNLE